MAWGINLFNVRFRNMFRDKVSEDTLKLLPVKDKTLTYILCISGVSLPLEDPQDPFLEVERFPLVRQGLPQLPSGFPGLQRKLPLECRLKQGHTLEEGSGLGVTKPAWSSPWRISPERSPLRHHFSKPSWDQKFAKDVSDIQKRGYGAVP